MSTRPKITSPDAITKLEQMLISAVRRVIKFATNRLHRRADLPNSIIRRSPKSFSNTHELIRNPRQLLDMQLLDEVIPKANKVSAAKT